ncbi:MAG: SHOCT domain-containing protein [Thermoleophilaceae bacterium]|nr:SHOCT domain-containing protein [Thermoleophilaceae bacterium]
MPGLIRGVARTAVIAGTATHVSNNVSRRQANRWAEQEQSQPGYMAPVQPQQYEQAPPPAAAPAEDPIEKLKEYAQLHDQGILTDEEFAAQKAKLLG